MKLELNYYEKDHKKISVGNMIKIYSPQMILCNNIVDFDEELAMELYSQTYVEEFDDEGNDVGWYDEIYQFYIVDDTTIFKKLGYPTATSNILDIDVVGITHFGMSWHYILSDIDINDERFRGYFE